MTGQGWIWASGATRTEHLSALSTLSLRSPSPFLPSVSDRFTPCGKHNSCDHPSSAACGTVKIPFFTSSFKSPRTGLRFLPRGPGMHPANAGCSCPHPSLVEEEESRLVGQHGHRPSLSQDRARTPMLGYAVTYKNC